MKTFKKVLSLCFAVVLFVVCSPVDALASESVSVLPISRIYEAPDYEDTSAQWYIVDGSGIVRSTPTLGACSISMGYTSEGLYAEFYTNCSHTSEEVGVRDIKIQKKVGIFWSTVATSAGGSCADCSLYGGSILYTNAEYGETYRISCVHYAYCGGYDLQLENVTGGHKYTY